MNKQTNKQKFLDICREDIKRDGIEDLLKWLEESDFWYNKSVNARVQKKEFTFALI